MPLALRAERVQSCCMNVEAFKLSLTKNEPPELSHALRALWWDAKGDWDKAHKCAQQDEESSAVFGMPKEAIRRGGATAVVPLRRIAETALRMSAEF